MIYTPCPFKFPEENKEIATPEGLKEGLSDREPMYKPYERKGKEDNYNETVPHNGGKKS